jgi:hypothetical protein
MGTGIVECGDDALQSLTGIKDLATGGKMERWNDGMME